MIDTSHMEPLMAAIRAVETGGTENYSQVRQGRNGDPAIGAYGIQRSRWPGLADGAGLPGADWRSPKAQDYVAGFWLSKLADMYGALDLVAAAWIGGTTSADTLVRRGYQGIASITNNVIKTYVERVSQILGEDNLGTGPGNTSWVFPVAGANKWNAGDFLYHRTAGQIAAGRSAIHEGIDIMAAQGTPILSPVGGVVVGAGTGNVAGNYVKVKGDDGVIYYFAHMAELPAVTNGQRIGTGTYLGGVGATGNAQGTSPHLHFTMKNAASGNLINPTTFLSGAGGGYGAYAGVAPSHAEVHTPGGSVGDRMHGMVNAMSNAVANGERVDYRTLGADATDIADPIAGEGVQDLTDRGEPMSDTSEIEL